MSSFLPFKKTFLLVTVSVLPLVGHGQTLTGLLSNPAGETINFDLSQAWAAYNTTGGAAITDANNLGLFSAAALNGTQTGLGLDSKILLTFNNGTKSATSEPDFAYGTNGVSLTTTLFSSNETFDFYLSSFVSTTTLTATLRDSTDTSVLGTYTETAPFPTTDGSHGYEDLNLAITDAAQGDVLTFTETVSGTNAGINGITANATSVPEPGAAAMLGLGAGAFFLASRRRSSAWAR